MRIRFAKCMAGCVPIAGRSVLDVGCGPGVYAVELARKGAARVVEIDVSHGMIELARARAGHEHVADRCVFVECDFLTFEEPEPFDYVIALGFMDYVRDPHAVVKKLVVLTGWRAFVSFPASGGVLAWQRRLRYRRRTYLRLYSEADIVELFKGTEGARWTVERIGRDFFCDSGAFAKVLVFSN